MDNQAEKITFIAHSLVSEYKEIIQMVRARTFGLEPVFLNTEQWRFRRLIHNIMIARTNDEKALKSCTEMFAIFGDRIALAKAERRTLINIMETNEVQWPGKKADSIIQTAQLINSTFNGIVPENHKALCTLPGIGRHAATVTLALAFNHSQEFAVDTHVSRIARRLGLVEENTSDLKIEQIIKNNAPIELLANFSRSFVDFGKRICSFHPQCSRCFLTQYCPSAKVNMAAAPVQPNHIALKKGVYTVPSLTPGKIYTVVAAANGAVNCTCQAFKYRKTCKHIHNLSSKVVDFSD